MNKSQLIQFVKNVICETINEIKAEIGLDIPIGDGFILKRTTKDIFKIYKGNSLSLSCLVVTVDKNNEGLNIPYVKEVMAYERGEGLYRRILPILKDTFGSIRSDDSGYIEYNAEKAWKAAGARHVLTTDDAQIYGGSWYVLEK
jgi:hypothetical protein